MKLEIRDKAHAAILEKAFNDQSVIDFHGISLAIDERGYSFDGQHSWTFGFREVYKAQWQEGGKPPAGTICEYTDVHGLKWYGCEIIAYHGDHVWLRTTVAQRDHVKVFSAFRFRPLRTAEQIAEEERDDGIRSILKLWNIAPADEWNYHYDLAAKTYDAGYKP